MRFVAAVTAFVAMAGGTMLAQGFEAVSIKRHVGGGAGEQGAQPGGYVARNVPLFLLISLAYPVRSSDDIIGAPDWFYDEPYDVIVRYERPLTSEQSQAAWRKLFAERTGVKWHLEQREKEIFELLLARAGSRDGRVVSPNLKKSEVDCSAGGAPAGCTSFGAGMLTTKGLSMAGLARTIQPLTGRTVADRTGLEGFYAFSMVFAMTRPNAPIRDNAADQPAIFTALQEQLGLKLAPARGRVDVLVIEHIDRPTEN